MKRFLDMLRGRRRGPLQDILTPRGESLQIILRRRGEPEAAIYVDNEGEFRSPSLAKDKATDEAPHRNSR